MIGAVVLAAGRSVRMGVPKLLLPIQGKALITGIVDELAGNPLLHIVVVVGSGGGPIREALAGREVKFAVNPNLKSDMLSSVRCGLRALPQTCEAVMVVLGDQPGLRRDLVTALLRAYRMREGSIVVPAFCGRRGHPVLFGSRWREEVLTCYDGTGLRGLLAAHAGEVREVPVATDATLRDLDTPEDYMQYSRFALE